MSHSFSGGGFSPSISHNFSGGTSRSFSPQSSHFLSNNSGLSGNSHSQNFGSSNWAHGQSSWQMDRGSSTWQQHLSDWNHGQHWNGGNWWGNNNWRGNFWWGRYNNFSYFPSIGIGAGFWFPWWYNDSWPSYGYGYSGPYSYGPAIYPAAVVSQPEAVQTDYVDTAAQNADAQPAAGESAAGGEFFAQATSAFQNGQYRDALRLANHAAVESPQNPKAHELISLAMFASAEYRGAAVEAHAALAFGPPADWATLYAYYGDDATYTNQLRALEKYSHDNPTAADARFLRAYQYLMMGHTPQALDQLREAVKLTPNDKLAAELLKKYGEGDAGKDRLVPPAPAPLPANPTPSGGGPRPAGGDGGVDS
jgi:Flp pilus assembly protein TadD